MVTIPMCIVVRPILASRAEEVIEPPIAATGIATVATAQASGRQAEAGLEHHVERDHHPAHRADEAEHDGQAGDVGAAAQDRRLDQRRLALARAARLEPGERRERDDAGRPSRTNDQAGQPCSRPWISG